MSNEIKLSEDEIDQLFTFCRSKYVRYLDLQYEIVDHLASGIESEMSNDPTLKFKSALNKVYGKFPITGFSKLVEEKEKAMSKYWWKKAGESLLEYISTLKILYIFMAFVISFTLLFYFHGIAIIGIGGLCAVVSIFNYFKMKKMLKTGNSGVYLVLASFDAATYSIWITTIIMIITEPDIMNTIEWTLGLGQITLLSILWAFVIIWLHALQTVFPKMIKEELNKKYKHLGIELS